MAARAWAGMACLTWALLWTSVAVAQQEAPAAASPDGGEAVPGVADLGQETGAPLIRVGRRPRDALFSFGLHVGQPSGLQLKARLIDIQMLGVTTTHSLVTTVGYDFFYGGLTLGLDYRLDFWTWEFLKQDARVSLWVGGGPRVSVLEPVRQARRESPVTVGARITPGATLVLDPLPMEFGIYGTPLGFDVNTLGPPRWRPEFGLEVRARFPYAPPSF